MGKCPNIQLSHVLSATERVDYVLHSEAVRLYDLLSRNNSHIARIKLERELTWFKCEKAVETGEQMRPSKLPMPTDLDFCVLNATCGFLQISFSQISFLLSLQFKAYILYAFTFD